MRAVEWDADKAALHGTPLRLAYASLSERYEGKSVADDFDKPPKKVMDQDITEAAEWRASRRQSGVKITAACCFEEPEYHLKRQRSFDAGLPRTPPPRRWLGRGRAHRADGAR